MEVDHPEAYLPGRLVALPAVALLVVAPVALPAAVPVALPE
ncbi:MAG: hypothetical protein NPIRA06_01680 [Nitrospirales bacterium]|nr:MAG: hypothetical protein NPIRA06_01680 [Nitrospirales bacterium]